MQQVEIVERTQDRMFSAQMNDWEADIVACGEPIGYIHHARSIGIDYMAKIYGRIGVGKTKREAMLGALRPVEETIRNLKSIAETVDNVQEGNK